MLSRVAQRIYWAGRYHERVENTARLVNVYTNLLMDLPRNIDISWFNLVTINSNVDDFEARFKVRDEKNVVKFLLSDTGNQSSLLSSLQWTRENLRTTRDVMPEGVWELVNEQYIFVKEHLQSGILRTNRHEFLEKIIQDCELIRGHIVGTMPRDSGWEMWRLGLNIERADMSTRILDAGTHALASDELADDNTLLTVWGNVLQSASAHLAFRRVVSTSITAEGAIDYLLNDEAQPRGVRHCVLQLQDAVKHLPKRRKILLTIKSLLDFMSEHENLSAEPDELSHYFNELQINIAELHQLFTDAWFNID